MPPPDIATIQVLRSDLALQITREVERRAQSQIVTARQLGIPQPTLSKIVRGRVADLSLELLIRIAVRAGLPVVLQTGTVPEEAGVFVARGHTADRMGMPSSVAERAREELLETARGMTAERRLEAHLKHTELVSAFHRAAAKARRR